MRKGESRVGLGIEENMNVAVKTLFKYRRPIWRRTSHTAMDIRHVNSTTNNGEPTFLEERAWRHEGVSHRLLHGGATDYH